MPPNACFCCSATRLPRRSTIQSSSKAFAKILERLPMRPKLEFVHGKLQSVKAPDFPENDNIMVTAIYDFVVPSAMSWGHPREKPPVVTQEDAFGQAVGLSAVLPDRRGGPGVSRREQDVNCAGVATASTHLQSRSSQWRLMLHYSASRHRLELAHPHPFRSFCRPRRVQPIRCARHGHAAVRLERSLVTSRHNI